MRVSNLAAVLYFTVTPDDLMFYNQQLEYKCEPGDFNIMVGPNSRDVQTLKFSLK